MIFFIGKSTFQKKSQPMIFFIGKSTFQKISQPMKKIIGKSTFQKFPQPMKKTFFLGIYLLKKTLSGILGYCSRKN